MANRTFPKYLPARLKPLSSPAVWAPLTVFALASIFMWEYHQNPDWFARPQVDTVAPASDLTPEEQARLSDIDTVDVLLNSLNKDSSPSSSSSSSGSGASPSGATGLGNENTLGAQDPASSNKLSGRENPFAAYEEQYKFPGSNSSTASSLPTTTLPAARPADGTAGGNLGLSNSSSLPASGALSEALGRQQDSRTATDPSRQNTADSASQNASQNASQSTRAATAPSGVSLPSAQPSNSGIVAPFIRTTPDMSPPPGTTGYKTPASSNLPVFNAAPQQPSRSPYSNTPAFGSNQQPAARPVTPAASSVPSSDGKLYTAPSFTQPEQNRRGQ